MLVILFLISGILSCGNRPDVSEPVKIPVILNETITNEYSDTSDLHSLDKDVRAYMKQWGVNGSALCIMKNDSLVYAKGYGISDIDKSTEANTLFRLASVSKLVTAAGIMKMQEDSLLSLSDKVFGPGGIFDGEDFAKELKHPWFFKITVENLLRHQAGFTVYAGDPMFNIKDLIIQNHLDTIPDSRTLAKIYLRRRLGPEPGTDPLYSNFGYLLLSMIIEKLSGENYEDWIQKNILRPAGCYDFHIANNYYEQRWPGETRYFPHDASLVLECNNSGRMVERAYGGSDIHGLSGGGAWVASAPELMRFVASIDGRDEVKDVLSKESIAEMTKFISPESYGIGWNDITEDGTWTRTGTLAETNALIKYYSDGECWIYLTNTGTFRGARHASYTNAFFNRERENSSKLLPRRDMFHISE